jgi:hypothetical protein
VDDRSPIIEVGESNEREDQNMAWMTIHYETGPNTEPYLAEIVWQTGKETGQPFKWAVLWSETLKPGQSQDVPDRVRPPPGSYPLGCVQFKTTPDNDEAPPGTIMYKSGITRANTKATLTKDRHIVVS